MIAGTETPEHMAQNFKNQEVTVLLHRQFVSDGFGSYRKLIEREEAVQVVDGQAGSERAETVVRVNLSRG
jgi:hypothetical protein